MATNQFNNIAYITEMAMDALEASLDFTKQVNRGYDDSFRETGGKIGDTANIRVPGYYSVTDGKVAVPQGYNETFVPVTLNQKNVALEFSSKEMRLNVDDFMSNVIRPAIIPLANRIDSDGFQLIEQVPNAVGIPGTLPTDLSTVLDGCAQLDEFLVPKDGNRAAVLCPRHQSSIVNGLKTLFNPIKDISDQYKYGNMGELAAGCKFSVDQNAPTHQTGTWGGTPLVNGTTLDGATSVVTDGWTSGASALKAGDVVTFDGVYAVQPVSKANTGQLRQFYVTADVSDTTGAMTIAISPAMILTGPNQNITALPLNDAVIKVFGAVTTYSNKLARQSVVFHKDAFLLACADLGNKGPRELCSRVRSPKLNISMRMIKFYNGNSDDELYRIDVLYGWAALRKDFAVRILG